MAVLGLKINGGRGTLDTSLADAFLRARFGDADTEMQLARTRSQLANDEYERRYKEALTNEAAAKAEAERFGLESRQNNLPVIQDFYAGLVEPPVPVEAPPDLDELPANINLDYDYAPVPVEVGTPAEIPFSGSPLVANELKGFTAPVQQTAIPGLEMPVAVDAETDTYEPPAPSGVSPEAQARYEQDREARRAEAALIIGGGGNAAQMAQGLGIGEGIIKSGSRDPAVRTQGNVLYTGSHAPTSATGTNADFEMTMKLRDKFGGTPEFEKWSVINTGYQNMLSAMESLGSMDQGDPRRGPADMRLIYNYLKLLDPNTGVKEGEYSGAAEAGGRYASIWNLYDRVVSGAILDQGTREAYLTEAFGMVDTANRDLQPLVDQYTAEAERFEIAPERVIRERPVYEKPQGDALPTGVSEEIVARVRAANPDWSREMAIRHIVAKLVEQRAAEAAAGSRR